MSPKFLVGTPPLDPVTDAEPIGDFDTGYAPRPRIAIPVSGAWVEGDDPGERQFVDLGPHELEWYSANEMALTMTLSTKPKVAPEKTSAKK